MSQETQRLRDGSRCNRLFKLYQSKKLIVGKSDSEIVLSFLPETFWVWFCVTFWIFSLIAAIITHLFSGVDYDNNPLVDTFGAYNICIFYDFPPFSYFGAALYVPVMTFMILYLILDNIRVYFNYLDNENEKYSEITHSFYIIYSILTIFEIIAFIWFIQIFATSPIESVEIHYLGFMGSQFALWTMSVSHYVYFNRIGILKNNRYRISGYLYVGLLIMSIVIRNSMNLPNLFFHAKLWIKWGDWTLIVHRYNDALYMLLTTILPVLIYTVLIDDLDEVKLTLKSGLSRKEMTKRNSGESNDDEQHNFI